MVSKNITIAGKDVDSLLNHLQEMTHDWDIYNHIESIQNIFKGGSPIPGDILKGLGPPTTKFSPTEIKKMDRKTVIQELYLRAVKETDVSRGDGAPGKPLIGDLRNKLIEIASDGKVSAKKAPAKKEPAAKKAPAKKEPAAKKAPAKKEPAKSEVVVTNFPELGYGLDQHEFVYTLPSKGETGEVVARLVNDEVKPLVKTSIAKLEKLGISFSKKTAKELKDLLVPEESESEESESEESEEISDLVDSEDVEETEGGEDGEHEEEGGIFDEEEEEEDEEEEDEEVINTEDLSSE